MTSNDRSSSSSGGVKSLLAKFEASQQASAPTTPNARGRSPAGASNSNGTNGDSARPSSTVRTTFVPVERSTSTPIRKPTPSSQSTGSPSEVKSTGTSTDITERDASSLQDEAQAAIDNIAGLSRDEDEAPAEAHWGSGLAAPPNSLATASTGILTPAATSVGPTEPPTPLQAAQPDPNPTELTPRAGQSPKSNSQAASSQALLKSNPKTPVKTSASNDEPQQHLTAPVNGPVSKKSLGKARAKSPARRDVSMDRLSISPVPSFKDGTHPDIDALQDAQERRPSLILRISPDAEDLLGPRPLNPASIRRQSEDVDQEPKIKGRASPIAGSSAKNATPRAPKPKTPVTPKSNGTFNKAGQGSTSKRGASTTKPATNGTRKPLGPVTPVQTGFHKPKPRSPTRPVNLPAHLVAPTAASAAKHGLQPAAETSRSGRRGSSVSDIVPRRSTMRASTIGPRRSSVKPKTSPAHTSPRTSLPVRAPAESFLERMMRPTASSASKVHAKTDATTGPKRR